MSLFTIVSPVLRPVVNPLLPFDMSGWCLINESIRGRSHARQSVGQS